MASSFFSILKNFGPLLENWKVGFGFFGPLLLEIFEFGLGVYGRFSPLFGPLAHLWPTFKNQTWAKTKNMK